MPVIRFTEADKLAGKTLEKGGYSAILTKIDGPQPSASKKSITYQATFQITKAPNAGKELEVFFNSETSGNSLLGTRQYCPQDWMLKVVAAIQGIPYDQVSLDVDTDELTGKSLDLLVDIQTSEGNILNIITGFAPEGKALTAVPW